jgi:hypothetical protein
MSFSDDRNSPLMFKGHAVGNPEWYKDEKVLSALLSIHLTG